MSSSSSTQLPDLSVSSLFDQNGKVVLITGGGTGLGFMMATAFAMNGAARVYIASRKMANLEKAAAQLNALRPGCCIALTADLTSKKGCDDLTAQIHQREPQGLDVLVNNSGLSWGSPMEYVDEKKGWDRVFDVNVKSLFYLTVALVPLLEKKATLQRPANVINVTSIVATFPNAYMPTTEAGEGAWSYVTSKAAAAHLTRSLSVKLKPKNINVNALAPGFFPSNMTASGLKPPAAGSSVGADLPTDPLSRSHPSGHMGSAKDIAGPVLLLASPAGGHLSGITITMDGGMTLAPLTKLPEDLQKYYRPGVQAHRDAKSRYEEYAKKRGAAKL